MICRPPRSQLSENDIYIVHQVESRLYYWILYLFDGSANPSPHVCCVIASFYENKFECENFEAVVCESVRVTEADVESGGRQGVS